MSKFAKRLRCSTKGNATLLVALGMPALIGGAGFATDLAQYYMWKRELQHAVDQGAIAGAYELIADDKSQLYGDRATQEFSYNLQIVKDFASSPTVRLGNYDGGINNSVIVTASATKKLPFSSFLTSNALRIDVYAQAVYKKGDSFAACVKALAEDGTGIAVDGNSTLNAKCGIAALSCDTDGNAIDIADSAKVDADAIVACGNVRVPLENESSVTEGVTTLEDEFKDLPTPEPESETNRELTCSSGASKAANPIPGVYSSFVVKCKTTMAPGVYVIDGGLLDLTANHAVTGTGVMFVLKNGAQMQLGGQGNAEAITLSPMTSAQFIGTKNEPYADRYGGILVFEDRSSEIRNGGKHIFNGNSDGSVEGLIYTPANTLRINGSANIYSTCMLIAARRVEISGGANVTTLCPADESLSGGYVIGGVRLVA